jgi:hypothetical protein
MLLAATRVFTRALQALPWPEMSPERRFPGSRVVVVCAILVLLVTAFVVYRIVEVRGPGPDPSTIPARP